MCSSPKYAPPPPPPAAPPVLEQMAPKKAGGGTESNRMKKAKGLSAYKINPAGTEGGFASRLGGVPTRTGV